MKERSNTGASSGWWLRIAAGGILLAAAAAAVACSDDDKKDDAAGSTPAATQAATKAATPAVTADEKAVQQVFLDALDRWNANDLDGFVALFTDEGLVSSFGEEGSTAEEAKAGLADFLGSEMLSSEEFLDTSISGETATMDVVFAFGNALSRSKFGLVKVGADWKLNSEESDLVVDIPTNKTLVHVDANEFAFGVDTSGIDSNVAFELSNVGTQTHELGIARIPADADIDDLIQQILDAPEGEVPGNEFIGFTEAEVGATSNLVFTEALSSGRYLMLCFLSDTSQGEDGPPHATLGMKKEFTIK